MAMIEIPLPPHWTTGLGVLLILLGLSVLGLLLLRLTFRAVAWIRGERPKGLDRFKQSLGLRDASDLWVIVGVVIWSLLALTLLVSLFTTLAEAVRITFPADAEHLAANNAQSAATPTSPNPSVVRASVILLAGLTATLGAVIALPFTMLRLRITRDLAETAAEALFNDKINAASADLHSMRQVWRGSENGNGHNIWEADIVRRNAAIDRLEGLVIEQREERRDTEASRIARLLCTYVRELSREYRAADPPEIADLNGRKKWSDEQRLKRSDVQTAVLAISHLNRKFSLDLNALDLSGANLQGLKLRGLELSGSTLVGADFRGADATFSRLVSANLLGAKLQGADLSNSDIRMAYLDGIEMDAATALNGASATAAGLRNSNFGELNQLVEHLESMFADASVVLPGFVRAEDEDWPEHFSQKRLLGFDYFYEWHDRRIAYQEHSFDSSKWNGIMVEATYRAEHDKS